MIDPIAQPTREWAGMEAALEALGRVALLLNDRFEVVYAPSTLDTLVCRGAHSKLPGRPASDLFGGGVFDAGGPVEQALDRAQRLEGQRAFLRCSENGFRLVSLSIGRLDPGKRRLLGGGACYVVFIRPAEIDAEILEGASSARGFIAESEGMRRVLQLIEALHRGESTVLITGESGVGKEVVARAIHASSPRRSGPFVAVNCGALPANLLESELFGHVRGAFTGASRDRGGRVELAARGTLFLDEVGETELPVQVKLLRLLQERQYERLGESKPRQMDARVIAATNRNLEEAIGSGDFRQDLYYRLRVVPMHIPPLRERVEDIEPLARLALARIGARTGRAVLLSPSALSHLLDYTWPGNVRELENALEYAVALCQGQTLGIEHLPDTLRGAPDEPAPSCPLVTETDDDEASKIREALEAHRWNRSEAARTLGMSRTTLWRRMQALGLS